MWETVFALTNSVALVMWLALIAGTRKPVLLSAVMFAGVGLLCLAYAVIFAWLVGGATQMLPEYSVAGLMDFFSAEGTLVLGWTHYLAFDLFVGLWIARDADHKGFSRPVQAPVLLATFLVGPIGLLVWLAVREQRARALGPRR